MIPKIHKDYLNYFKIKLPEGIVVHPAKSNAHCNRCWWMRMINKASFEHSAPPGVIFVYLRASIFLKLIKMFELLTHHQGLNFHKNAIRSCDFKRLHKMQVFFLCLWRLDFLSKNAFNVSFISFFLKLKYVKCNLLFFHQNSILFKVYFKTLHSKKLKLHRMPGVSNPFSKHIDGWY